MRRTTRSFSVLCLIVGFAGLGSGCSKPETNANPAGNTGGSGTVNVTAEAGGATTADNAGIIVNGQPLSSETISQLQQIYPVQLPPGRYWYDPVSGAWGQDGQPVAGQMVPNLALGGPLAANASRGTSGVFINGRQITLGEKNYIEAACQTPVAPARYWIQANGAGGYEGGPAIFNLGACRGMNRSSGRGGSMSDTYCDANGACTSSGILGTITTY